MGRRGDRAPLTARRLAIAAGVALAGVALTVGLGLWQLDRRAWKAAILADIARAEADAPVALGDTPPGRFARVVATGRFAHDRAARYGVEVRDGQSGTRLIVPLLRDGGVPVLVDRGFVPNTRAEAIAEPAGEVAVTGYVRPADARGWFTPADDPAGRRFFALDPAAIGLAVGLPDAAPFVLVALGPRPAAGYPDPARALPRPRDNHLSYAVTWFGLAGALVAVFVAFVLQERRR